MVYKKGVPGLTPNTFGPWIAGVFAGGGVNISGADPTPWELDGAVCAPHAAPESVTRTAPADSMRIRAERIGWEVRAEGISVII